MGVMEGKREGEQVECWIGGRGYGKAGKGEGEWEVVEGKQVGKRK